MYEEQVTIKGLVVSRQRFRKAGASEEQLERFEELSDVGKLMSAGLIRRGMASGPEDALEVVEEIESGRA